MNADAYNADYFERGKRLGLSLYTRYRWLPRKTFPLAHELAKQLDFCNEDRILDVGCAKGLLVMALRDLHYDAWGVDISEYAISQAPKDVRPYVRLIGPDAPLSRERAYDWTICKDVLEHMPYGELPGVLSVLRACSAKLFAVIPLGDGVKYNAPAYERDVTHVIREGIPWWCARFEEAGFVVERASTAMPHVKEGWDKWTEANGFFVLGERRSR